jgi:peptidoglycan glycosyltransferase
VIYRSHAGRQQRAMTTRASQVLFDMMERTVATGTARRLFKTRKPDPVLLRLRIGGKTGSIDNRSHDARFDWFVGFADDKHGEGQIVVAALVAHEEYIGVRAGTYARKAMTFYFQNHLARREESQKSKSDG